MTEGQFVYADANDPGLRFILPSPNSEQDGGLSRGAGDGHLCAIVGRGGSGKSILALQLVTGLLKRTPNPKKDRPHAAFYFSLEASPLELQQQISQLRWGDHYREQWGIADENRVEGGDKYSSGLYLLGVPSPAESLNALNLLVRQKIARQLHRIGGLAAIVIDPMGAVNMDDDLRPSLNQLKELAETHRTFVFILTEKYVFDKNPSIEHYSRSIIHLEHDPGQQHHRRMYVQKARSQTVRSGYHRFELQQAQRGGQNIEQSSKTRADKPELVHLSRGIRVFPSVEAQSAYAHEKLTERQQRELAERQRNPPPQQDETKLVPFLSEDDEDRAILGDEKIEVGSAVFLMGPPGTFKEAVASNFAKASAQKGGATIYVSFKAEFQTIWERQTDAVPFDPHQDLPEQLHAKTYFFDARSPLLTPEEVLFTVGNLIGPRTEGQPAFQRAIIWGLRRLYDFPNFNADRAVQFLEALVTLLKSQQITSLLVDWPDKQTPSTVPIVDLCQYIFLTRVCFSKESPELGKDRDHVEVERIRKGLTDLWGDSKRVALLRAQRTRRGVHHNQGAIIKQINTAEKLVTKVLPGASGGETFERRWLHYGAKWEEDLSLLS